MSDKIKALGIIGTGAMLILGIAASEPDQTTTPTITATPNVVAAPKTQEIKTVTDFTEPKPTINTIQKQITNKEAEPASNCHPDYSGCLKMNAGDYDCIGGSGNGPNYTGAVQVYGSDPFDLDRNKNGWGCEN